MQVNVLFFASLRQAIGVDRLAVEIEPGDSVDALVARVASVHTIGPRPGITWDELYADAREAYDFVMGRDSPAWEVAFAHAVLANAAHAAGDRALHARHYEMAHAEGTALPDA